MRTTTVRCGHLGIDGQLVKQLQQGVVHGHLAVPPATLDNELYHVNDDASEMGSKYVFSDMSCRTCSGMCEIIYIQE